jgi:hypothetical protein
MRQQTECMGHLRKNRSSNDALAHKFLKAHAPTDEIGLVETVRAVSGAITALADTLNALGLRIALARNAPGYGTGAETQSAYYKRLALLAQSAAGQVEGIQKLINAIEAATLHDLS